MIRLALIVALLVGLKGTAFAAPPLLLEQAPAAAQAAVLRAFRDIAPDAEQRKRYRMVVAFGSPLFLPDVDLPDPPGPADGFTLAQWRALPTPQRALDLLVGPDVDHYWPSRADGATVQYSTQFVLHFEARPPGRTALHIMQANPTRRHGKKFKLMGRTGPGFYWDIRPSAASSEAADALHAFLAAALSKQPK